MNEKPSWILLKFAFLFVSFFGLPYFAFVFFSRERLLKQLWSVQTTPTIISFKRLALSLSLSLPIYLSIYPPLSRLLFLIREVCLPTVRMWNIRFEKNEKWQQNNLQRWLPRLSLSVCVWERERDKFCLFIRVWFSTYLLTIAFYFCLNTIFVPYSLTRSLTFIY